MMPYDLIGHNELIKMVEGVKCQLYELLSTCTYRMLAPRESRGYYKPISVTFSINRPWLTGPWEIWIKFQTSNFQFWFLLEQHNSLHFENTPTPPTPPHPPSPPPPHHHHHPTTTIAVVPCAKFQSNHFPATWMRAGWNFHWIWITTEKYLWNGPQGADSI